MKITTPKLSSRGLLRPVIAATFLAWAIAAPVSAHQPFIGERPSAVPEGWSVPVVAVPDPTEASRAVYGQLASPGQVDIYVFDAKSDEPDLPVEAFVPQRASLADFFPAVALVAEGLSLEEASRLPFTVPSGFGAYVVRPVIGVRQIFHEPFSSEPYYHGTEVPFPVTAGRRYAVAIYDPSGRTGAYVLGLGSKEDFAAASWAGLLRDVIRVKLGLFGGTRVPLLGLIALLLFVAGTVASLGGWLAAGVFSLRLARGKRAVAVVKNVRELRSISWAGEGCAAFGAALFFIGRGLTGTAPFLVMAFGSVLAVEAVLSWKLSATKARKAAITARGAAVALSVFFVAWMAAVFFMIWQVLVLN